MMKKLILILCVLQGVLLSLRAQGEQQNIAYTDNNVRFTVISDGTLRLEYAPDGKFVDDKSFIAVDRLYPQVDYKLKTRGAWIEITTSKMKMRYKKDSGRFTNNNLIIEAVKGAFPFTWKPGMQQKGNLKGTYRTLDGMDGDTQTQTWVSDTKKGDKLKLEDGLLATDGWSLIDDSRGLLFDNDPDWDWAKERPANEGQDWYFMAYGHDYKQALKDYTLFAGKMPLPPRYAFGYWWSRYWLYSDKEFRNLIDNFHTYQIPLDVLVVDMDWHYTEKGKGGWTGWTWNRDLFPNPQGFLKYLKQNNVKVTLNLHPADGVAAYEEKYPEMAKDMGVDPATKQTIPWINSDKKFMKNMFKNILAPMEKDGVDFWWLDWQQGMFDSKMKNLSNTWWINYAFFSDMEQRRETRPMLYHRWGGLGNHRYQVGFSGDAVISWKSLDFQPYFNSTASNVLYGYWSHDLGGHIGSQIDPEMYTRWLQFGALSPIMRTHSQKGAKLNKEPWVFDKEYCDIIRETIRQRYVMAPYIYTERNGIYIIDLQKSVGKVDEAYYAVSDIAAQGGTILFVGTKKQAQDAIKTEAERCGMYYVNERWLGGMLTNFKTIQSRIARLKEIEAMSEDGTFDVLPKKEVIEIKKEWEKLEKNLGGIKEMKRIPDAIFVVDPKKERICVQEAHTLGIPLIGIADTNCDPEELDYVIPGNDDAIRAVKLIADVMANAVIEGKQGESFEDEQEEQQVATEEATSIEEVVANEDAEEVKE